MPSVPVVRCCLVILGLLVPAGKASEASLPEAVRSNLKSQVYLQKLDSLRFSHFTSGEVFEVVLSFSESKGRRLVKSLHFARGSITYAIDLSLCPSQAATTTMLFPTDTGVGFVLSSGDGEYARLSLIEVNLKTKMVTSRAWSSIELKQMGSIRRKPLKLINDENVRRR